MRKVRRVDSSVGVMMNGWRVRPGGRDWASLSGRGMEGEVVAIAL